MIKSKWSIISISLLFVITLGSCKSQTSETSAEPPNASNSAKSAEENPLAAKIQNFYKLFEGMPDSDLNCDDMTSKTSLGKEMVIEYVNTEVRNWSDQDWQETSYNAVMASKQSNYYLFVIEKEGPGKTQIYVNTYSLLGLRKSSIMICSDGYGNDITSTMAPDRSIFMLDDAGVSTYKLNTRGVYVKGN